MDRPSLNNPDEFAKQPFDFLIVGGGTAGLVVASSLSEHTHLVVGVLEAGSLAGANRQIDCPGLAGHALGGSLDWGFDTVPQPALRGRTFPYARGKVLGGSSALNYMTWNRAARQDYDDWRDLGNDGWGWDDLLPFFKKSETFHAPSETSRKATRVAFHEGVVGDQGPVQVSYPNEFTASHKLWHDTLNAVGVPSNDNHLAGSNIGCWTSIVSVDPGTATRSYAASAYYKPVASRPNLFVLTGAEVLKALLSKHGDDDEWTADGVLFTHGGIQFSAFASREVILSAGSVQSPQILELSGIGGRDILTAAGIPVKVDNPNVGEHLQDHLTTTLVFEVDPSLPNPDDLHTPSTLTAAHDRYTRTRTGPLTILPVSIAYVPYTHFTPPSALSSILPAPTALVSRTTAVHNRFHPPLSPNLGHVEFIFDLGNWGPPSLPTAPGKKYGSLLQILQYPLSRGSVHILPGGGGAVGINPAYFAGPHGEFDLELAAQAHRFAEKIAATQPLAGIIRRQVWPDPEQTSEVERLKEWLRSVVTTDWHPVGTCGMGGRQGREAGVVDERLRVYGVRGLRVVDASVFPVQIGAHLQATVYAVAEKGAGMVLEDWGVGGQG